MHDLIIRRIPVGGRELLRLDAGLELKKEKQGLFFFTICNCSLAKLRSILDSLSSPHTKGKLLRKVHFGH